MTYDNKLTNYKNLIINVGIGFGYEVQNFSIYYENFFEHYNDIDIDGQNYEKRVIGKNMNEEIEIKSISMPLYLSLYYPLKAFESKFMLFTKFGLKTYLNVSSKYKLSQGKLSYRGYYPEYDVELKDLYEYGFFEDVKPVIDTYDLDMKTVVIYGTINLGIEYEINTSTSISISMDYLRSISKILKENQESTEVSRSVYDYNSILYFTDSNINFKNLGFGISLRFCL